MANKINNHFLQLIDRYTFGTFDINTLSGKSYAYCRQQIIEAVTNERHPKSVCYISRKKSGVNKMVAKKKKALTGSQRVKAVADRKTSVGLVPLKLDVHPDDVDAIRKYAGKKPLTKACLKAYDDLKKWVRN